MRAQQVQQVLALEDHLDKHDQLLRHSKAQYLTYAANRIEELTFQTDLVKQALNAGRRWTAELATGSGKTIIAARIAGERLHDGPVIYVSSSAVSIGDIEGGVINKFAKTFDAAGRVVELGTLNDLSRANDVSFMTPRVLVSMLQREPGRIGDLLRRASCFIVDEAHHFPQDIDGDLQVYGELYNAAETYVRNGLTVAMTGTWGRLDRKHIMGVERPDVCLTVQDAVNLRRCAELYGIQVITDVRAKGASVRGDLYDFHLTGEERARYLDGIVDCMWTVYRRYPVPFAAFARTVADATYLVTQFNQISRLGDARGLIVLTSTTPLPVRTQAVNDIIAGRRTGYVTCAVGEEAIDIPALEVVHLIRRTRSYARNAQAIGRELRVHPGKRRALVIDYQTMLEGVQDRFLGLSCDDLHDGMGANIGRYVNGGPIVAQKSYPQGELVGMTMSDERAVICINISSKQQKQQELLELARTGGERPRHMTSLGCALTNYTTKRSKIFDPAFTVLLGGIRPEWLSSGYASANKKQALRELAQRGERRPSKGTLGRAAKRYLTVSSKSYDQKLTDELQQLRPDWFYASKATSISTYKQGLIDRARTGVDRPSGQAWNRIKCLMRTDEKFRRDLLTARPDWHVTRNTHSNKLKAKLHQLASAGAPKPSGPLAEAFSRYCTRPSSGIHDAAFTAEMRLLVPDWFIPSATLVKRELLAQAQRGDAKPTVTTNAKLYWKWWGYIRPSHKTYDAAFTQQIFAIRPDWRPDQRFARSSKINEPDQSLKPSKVRVGWQCSCGCPDWPTHRNGNRSRPGS